MKDSTKDMIASLPNMLLEHKEVHGAEFDSLLITFSPDGSWAMTGSNSAVMAGFVLDQIAGILGTTKGTVH